MLEHVPLEQGNAIEIVGHVEALLADPDLAGRLGEGARRFAAEQLSWQANANSLAEFLRECSASGRPVSSAA